MHLGVAGSHREMGAGRATVGVADPVFAGYRAVPVCQYRTGDIPCDPGPLNTAVRFAGHPGDHPDALALGGQYTTGQHARVVAMGDAMLAIDPLRELERSDSVS